MLIVNDMLFYAPYASAIDMKNVRKAWVQDDQVSPGMFKVFIQVEVPGIERSHMEDEMIMHTPYGDVADEIVDTINNWREIQCSRFESKTLNE